MKAHFWAYAVIFERVLKQSDIQQIPTPEVSEAKILSNQHFYEVIKMF